MYPHYHGQYGEDEFLEVNHLLPEIGVFVDVGAGHPITFSNTFRLEQRGWLGVCIDADPRQVELLREHRKNVEHYAIGRQRGFVALSQIECPELSTTLDHLSRGNSPVTSTSIPAIDLESLLEKHGIQDIDLLSIDTEGTEIDVLESMDLNKHHPEVIIVEFNTFGRDSNEAVLREYFCQLPYQEIHKTFSNLLFKRR
ncbi:MAG: methyltransferase FkbM [Planctomycetaceae bacterium]|nr:methyltransferase FkbM [Planctomycetaceae bacterium]